MDDCNLSLSVEVYVPARLGSTRLPRKCLLSFNGTPLILIVLHTLTRCKTVRTFVVNTESEEIASVVRDAGFKVYRRCPTLAVDSTTTEEILQDYLATAQEDYVAVINPTSPLLKPNTIDEFLIKTITEGYDTAFSVASVTKHCFCNGKPVNFSPFGPHPRTQDVTPVHFLNWAIVAWRTVKAKSVITHKGDSLYVGRVGFIEIHPEECIDIDTLEDFKQAEVLAQHSANSMVRH